MYEVLAGADRLEEGGQANSRALHLPGLCACMHTCTCMREITVNFKGIERKKWYFFFLIPQSGRCLEKVTKEKQKPLVILSLNIFKVVFEMVHQAKGACHQALQLEFDPYTHMVEIENWLPQVVL